MVHQAVATPELASLQAPLLIVSILGLACVQVVLVRATEQRAELAEIV